MEDARRLMLPCEQLASLGYPCLPAVAKAAHVDSQPNYTQPHGQTFSVSTFLPVLAAPCNEKHIIILPKDLIDLNSYSNAAVRKMAGNGMNLCQAGFVLLMCILCVQDK